MTQELTPPKTEQEFRNLQDKLYKITRQVLSEGNTPSFKGIVEIACSDVVIVSAIHNIKANHGSKTAGVDGTTINDILTKNYDKVIQNIKHLFDNYDPDMVRRVYIPKKGKSGKRPLGIPTVADRIVQECIRITIEPIFEAQFFQHSYGFRPMRDTKHAIERIVYIMNRIGYKWVVEGDIKGFFDNVNHTILIKQMWHMGIKDRRLLMIIKAMLKAGIMDEVKDNPQGTPQGGIISPLLANIYLHKLDYWITREWEEKDTRHNFNTRNSRIACLRLHSSITKPAYYVRYADDWVLFTNSKTNAEKWKFRIKEYLKDNLKLELSEDKTHITDTTKKSIKFLGFSIKMRNIEKGQKFLGYVYPDIERLKPKIDEISNELRALKHHTTSADWLINDITLINSKIRGIINYYNSAPAVNLVMRQFREKMKYTSYKALKKYGGKWIPINQCFNLKQYEDRTELTPAVYHNNLWYGIIPLSVATWKKKPQKNQEETPYTPEGRELHKKRTKQRPLLTRVQELMEHSYSRIVILNQEPIYNFEYFMNRCYAFNRDKGRCKICGEWLDAKNTQTHHLNNKLPIEEINKVPNLVSLCNKCHILVHKPNISDEDICYIDPKGQAKLLKYREIIHPNLVKEETS